MTLNVYLCAFLTLVMINTLGPLREDLKGIEIIKRNTHEKKNDNPEGLRKTTQGMSPRKPPAGGASDVMTFYDI